MSADGYLLALEGGGTRSQAALMDHEGKILSTGQGGDVNTNFTPYAEAQAAVRSAASSSLSAAGVPGSQVSLLVQALVGPRFSAETFGDLCPNARYRYYSERDVVFARAAIFGPPHGVGLVAATGATAFAVRRDGQSLSLGGWGSLLGDEGSAYHLGLEGLRAAVRAFEQREDSPTQLVEAVCQHFHVSPEHFQHELIQLAYGQHMKTGPLSRAAIGSFAATVTRLAAQGDKVAARLVRQSAADLADLALHAARRLFAPQDEFVVVAAGGMTAAGDLILGELRQRLAAEFPHARLLTGSLDPAEALGRLALANPA